MEVFSGETVFKLVFFCAFLLGILLANLCGRETLGEYGIFNTYFLKQFEYAGVRHTELLLYILRQRLPSVVLLFLFGVTEYWYAVNLLFLLWNGGTLGFLIVSAISNLGIRGLFLAIAALLPQYILYVWCYLILLRSQSRLHGQMRSEGSRTEGGMTACLISGVAAIPILLLGIAAETYLNPYLIKYIIKLF